MLQHHIDSIENLKKYYENDEGVIAVILDGSVVKGNARPDSDIDAIVVVTEGRHEALAKEGRLAEVITGYCTYEGGYFDVKYKTKETLKRATMSASEPTRNAYEGAQTVFTKDAEIPDLVAAIGRYPEHERDKKMACFMANLKLNREYFMSCVKEDNAYMRAHLAQEVVYSVYRLVLLENRVLFPCNRRLEDTVKKCKTYPAGLLKLGAKFLKEITAENCEAFVGLFVSTTKLPFNDEINSNLTAYCKYYEDWWMDENPPFPNEW